MSQLLPAHRSQQLLTFSKRHSKNSFTSRCSLSRIFLGQNIISIFILFFVLFVNTLSTKAEVQQAFAQKDNQEEFVLFIVDFSNSMTERLNGTKKINMVLDTMQELLPQISKNQRVGLRVYGHKGNGFLPTAACRASSLIVPMTRNSTSEIQSALFSLKPTGWTPITYSLKQAINIDFAGVDGKKRIILLSDGGENCDESPCDYIMEITKHRQDITIDVIAFNIYDQEANNQLKCTALVTSGKFYSANTAAELLQSLQNSLNVQKEVQGVIISQ